MNTKTFQEANFKCISYFASVVCKNIFLVCSKGALTPSFTLHLRQGYKQVHSQ